jgi:uncharacterized protein
MANSRAFQVTFHLLIFARLALPVWGQQPAASAHGAAPQSGGIPHFEFDRKPEPIIFRDGDVQLSGVLVEPEGVGPFPAVVFAHGAGPATHDEPAFVIHANSFLRQGFAVLSYDKRGSGGSTGNLELSDYDDLAADLEAAVAYLRTRTEIAKSKIGVLGRSEGGWVGTIAAARS